MKEAASATRGKNTAERKKKEMRRIAREVARCRSVYEGSKPYRELTRRYFSRVKFRQLALATKSRMLRILSIIRSAATQGAVETYYCAHFQLRFACNLSTNLHLIRFEEIALETIVLS
ncbi:hypothetical protein PUN28_006317 [Cardiocondyla obscurior]|uniref:Uncharacterized protein n=1 Tax=Cardiocondyla obscurior TaxID=286306 RepID=A0AAW2GE89_9HYME